jgi:carboxyl-terminal processing protease
MRLAVRYLLILVCLIAPISVPAPVDAQVAPGPFVKQAFDLLMDRFVTPPSSATLLAGGWSGGLDFLTTATGADVSEAAPSYSGDRGRDWNAFLAAYPKLVAAGGASLDQHGLDYAVVRGMTKSLDSTHTFIQAAPPVTGQSYGGVGLQVSTDLIVTDVFPGTPAEAAGVRLGDRLVAVDGASVEGVASDEVSSRVRGPVGDAVQLTVRRGAQPDPVVLTATRAEITVPWVSARVLDGGMGYLRLRNFPPPDGMGQFDAAIATLDGADIKSLVIDVRGNSGGPISTSERVVSRFIPDGPLYQRSNRQGQTSLVNADGSAWHRSIPIVVLVNKGSAGSGGELLASALREHGLGYIVGSHTAGFFSAGPVIPLQDGSILVIATESWRTGQGQEIEHVGLEPDQVVELDPSMLADGHDSQLDAALDYLRGKLGQ